MQIAIDEAEKGLEESNAPFGAVIVDENWNIVSKTHNKTKLIHDPTAHAEILALREADVKKGSRDLSGYKIFTNAEPCAMCTAAIIKSGIKEIYTGILDEKIKDTELTAKDILKYSKEEILFEDGILKDKILEQLKDRLKYTKMQKENLKKNIFIIHGTKGDKNSHWFPWMKQELEKYNFNVILENFPTPENQSLKNWLKVLEKHKDKINEETIFVVHSIGGPFLLNFLERLEGKIHSAYIISGFKKVEVNQEYDELNKTFMKENFDFEKIKNSCENFYVFHSKNDPYVPVKNAYELIKDLNAKKFIYKNAGHFNSESGYLEFQDLLELIIEKEVERKFEKWSKVKEDKHFSFNNRPLIKEGDIWWSNVGQNIGYEMYGKSKSFTRPVLVFKKLSGDLFLGIPLTSTFKKGSWYVDFKHHNKIEIAVLSQARTFSVRRLENYIGQIDKEDFKKIKKAFRELYLD